jgi:hypothetical protein
MTQVDITKIDRDFFGFGRLWSEFVDIRGHVFTIHIPSAWMAYGWPQAPVKGGVGRTIAGGCRLADDDQRIRAQKRSNPNIMSIATVTTAEISTDPKQPRRFEKRKT